MRYTWALARNLLPDAPDLMGLMVWTVYEMAIWAGARHLPPFLGCRPMQVLRGRQPDTLRACMCTYAFHCG